MNGLPGDAKSVADLLPGPAGPARDADLLGFEPLGEPAQGEDGEEAPAGITDGGGSDDGGVGCVHGVNVD